jgi:phosphate transport system permease protein
MLLFIVAYTLVRGVPSLTWTLLTAEPADMGRSGGILPTVVGTVVLAMGGVVIAAPFGVGTAVYLVEYTREGWLTRVIRFGVDALAGIPSIIYGLFGFVFFVLTLGLGWSIASGALTLAIMILPTIVRTAEEALRAVPDSYREVSLSLGAHKWEMIATVALPAALPGIVTGIILGIGRCVGETAAVILTAGSSLRMPTSLFSPARTMSVHFYILAREGISDEMAWATGAILVVSILLVNVVINWLVARLIRRRVAR